MNLFLKIYLIQAFKDFEGITGHKALLLHCGHQGVLHLLTSPEAPDLFHLEKKSWHE